MTAILLECLLLVLLLVSLLAIVWPFVYYPTVSIHGI